VPTVVEMMEAFLFLITFLLPSQVTGVCQFVDLVASCDMTLGGVPVTAYARVNHCHNPVDVTFQVMGKDPSTVSWRYTYVTTNLAENVVLSKHIMLAMMASQKEDGRRINIQARFLLDGSGGTELEFLDTDLTLPVPQKNCLTLRSRGGAGWIAGACLLGVAVASLVISLAVIRSRTGLSLPAPNLPARIWRRFGHHSSSSGRTVVQYVVPADTPSDLKVYVSTADGLQPVHNNNKSELHLSPSALVQSQSSVPTKATSKTSSKSNKKSENKRPESPAKVGGISNSAFEWDEGDTNNDDGEGLVKSDEDVGSATGARPKQRHD